MTYPGVYDRAMSTQAEVAAFVLAGGKSTRMGTDKAFVTLDGRTLVARALDVAHSWKSAITVRVHDGVGLGCVRMQGLRSAV